ncbi:diguanylate cyclase [Kineococcus sp. T13]|uniref:diguanylate cyclase n=1 Tax=Kineococcus vitellinus TaxID=2696565 RepID=UPI0014136895|nr:diguanylate cyclase [Kineococcus vitellinus]
MSGLAVVAAVSALLAVAVAVLAWRSRAQTPAAVPLACGLLGSGTWAAAVAAMGLGPPPAVQDALVLVEFAGVGVTVACLRVFLDAATGRPVRRGRLLLLLVEPVLLLAVIALDPRLHWFHETVRYVGDPLVRETTHGPAFWLHALYSYAVIASGVRDLLRSRSTSSGLVRRQATTMLVGLGVPVLANAVSITSPASVLPVDITPPAFVASGIVFAYAVIAQDLLRMVPVARGLVVDTMSDGVLVVDQSGRVVDLNAAGRELLRGPCGARGEAVGSALAQLLPDLAAAVGAGEVVTVLRTGDGRSLDVRARWIRDHRGDVLGRVLVVRDVTAVLAQQRALEEANGQLLEHVRTIERLRADLAEEASRDPLTGLRNRRRFVDDLQARLVASAASGDPLSLVLLDVDHFKAVNDVHGHAVGDDVLVAVAQALRTHARPEDVVRYGGEEFVVLLPHLDASAATERAEELRRACAQLRLEVEDLRLTVSAGVATSPAHGTTPDELLLAADRALYAAKSAGRDRVTLAD